MAENIHALVQNAFNNQYFVYVEELHSSRQGTPFQAGGTRNYTRRWRVKLKDRLLGANIICKAPAVAPYSPYATPDGKEFDYQALCVAIRLEEPEDPLDGTHKIVVAEYSTEVPDGGPPRFTGFGMDAAGSQNQPWMEPPHIEWDSEVTREAPPHDLDRKPYLNFARQPFRPAPTFEVARAVLVYERNEQSHDLRKQVRYAFSVNSDIFLGEAPGTVRLYPIRAVLKWRGGLSYWRTHYRFVFNVPEPMAMSNVLFNAGTGAAVAIAGPVGALAAEKTPLRTWQPKILNAGMMQLQSIWSAGPNFRNPIPIHRGGGAVTEPVLLTAAGREMRPDADGNWPEPVYVEFRQWLALPFTPLLVSGLGFPG